MIKIVFFDIDGTLIPFDTGELPASTKDSLDALRKNGIYTVLATGKSLSQLRKMKVMEAEFDGFITLNGQLIYDSDMNVYAGTPIDDGEMEILAGIFKANRIPFLLLGEKTRYINYLNDLVIEKQLGTNATIPRVGNYAGEKIYQITAFVDGHQRELLENVLDLCTVTAWDENGIDIIAKGGGKRHAIEQVLSSGNFERSETMAFGDAENDIKMLEFVGTGVAMGNATDPVKSIADYITTDIHDDGIKNALMHFGLI